MKSGLVKHTWLGFIRSPAFTQKLIEGILLGIFGFYTAITLITFGFMAPVIFQKSLPQHNPTAMVAGGICIYFFADLLMRYFFQKFPTASIKPYLLLPISRKKITRHIMMRSLLSPFNLILPAFLIPFFIVEVLPNESAMAAAGLLILATSLIITANFVTYAISVYSGSSKNPIILFVVLFLLFIYLEFKGFTKVHPYIFEAGESIISTPMIWPIVLLVPILITTWLYKKFVANISYHTVSSAIQGGVYLPVKGIFSRFGKPGIIMDLEIKLIMRSKRARNIAISCLLFLLFPLYVSLQMKKGETGGLDNILILFAAFFGTGGFALNYGQLMLSWNSMHFDLLMSRGFKIRDVFLAKYYLLALSCVLFFIVTLPYIFILPQYFFLALAMTFWNASFSIYGYMLLAGINSKRIDLNAGNMFNHEGLGFLHYVIIMPLMLFPFVIYGMGALMGGMMAGVFALGSIGLLGIIFHKKITHWCVLVFEKNRYKIAKAFRTK